VVLILIFWRKFVICCFGFSWFGSNCNRNRTMILPLMALKVFGSVGYIDLGVND